MPTQFLTNKIISLTQFNKPIIVAICGAADLGKSYLSTQLTQLLNDKQFSAAHLPLDSFLIDREERHRLGLSGYNLEAYHINDALKYLAQFKKKQPISFHPYHHKTGKKELFFQQLNPSTILIFDGLHTMNQIFSSFVDYTIFIYTNDHDLKKIRTAADLSKRDYTLEFSKKISQKEFDLYKMNIDSFKEIADCKLFLGKKWNYELR